MSRTRTAATRAFVTGLVAAAATCGAAMGAAPSSSLQVRARLAPVAGTQASGAFEGVLVEVDAGINPFGKGSIPRDSRWRLAWKLRLPALDEPPTATLRIRPRRGSARIRRVLCTRCSAQATGSMTLKGRQVARIKRGDAVVVVRTCSARLRGTVKVFVHVPVPTR